MSDSYTKIIYGCPLTSGRRSAPDLPDVSFVNFPGDVGFHRTYDRNQDYYWFGYQFSGAENGFGSYEPASPALVAEVDAAWAGLPEELQKSLGKPRILILAGCG